MRYYLLLIPMVLLFTILISGCKDDTASSSCVKSLEASEIVSSKNEISLVPPESNYMSSASGSATGISVIGQSTISVKPDIAILDIGVETFAESVALARQLDAKEMGLVM